jgi:hypothetical protein
MHMTFEKIEPTEHPAYKAARMIRDLHTETIEKIDGGFIFLKDGVDCSAEMRAQCVVQVALCDQIMERAKSMDAKMVAPAQLILDEFEKIAKNAESSRDGLAHIPEIGDYGHDT